MNGVTYSVVVYAYSKAGNRSDASAAVTGTPQPVARLLGPVPGSAAAPSSGGCASGSAGALALLGTAALLALARRKK